MQNKEQSELSKQTFVGSKALFIVTILVVALTIVSIWLFGLGSHRAIFENSIYSTTLLSNAFFIFLTTGLYKGIKAKDELGRITDKIKISGGPDLTTIGYITPDFTDGGDDIIGTILGIIVWVIVAFLLLLFIWIFGAILWTMILVFAAMLYWIFFRALRLVFKNANKCKGKLLLSAAYGFGYTVLYNFWIYGIILGTHYLWN